MVQALEARVRALETQKAAAVPADLITKLENLSLGPKEKPKESRGLLRVHRNPNKYTIIELCVQLSKQVQALEARVRALETQKAAAVPADLITKLENLSLGSKEKPKESRGLLRRGKERMVCNYKRLNDNTHKDQYSLPGINTIMAKVGHSRIYSKFDLKSGFHQVAMHPDFIEWTTFWTPLGLYEWLVMPFGLKNAPAVFQRKMDICFKNTEDFIAVYIDDILVFSPDEKSHAKHIQSMLEICQRNGLILSPTKMKIAAVQMDFLGSTIGHGEIKLQAHIITRLAQFPDEKLKETKGLRSWLGLLNYARSYIKDLGRLLSPLYSKVSPNGERRLNAQDWRLIREIKAHVQQLPNLAIPPEGCVIILETDGCMEGWGGICKWKKALKDPRSTERICAYASGKFNPIKSTIDAEIYACINSLEAFKIYYLDKPHLTLRTDCQAIISYFNKTVEHKPSRSRWIAFTDYITGLASESTEAPGIGLSPSVGNITVPAGLVPNTMMTIGDFYNHVQIAIQTRGYENWQGGEANLLITRGLVGRLSNTPNVGFAYEIEGVTEFLTSKGVKAIPGEKMSTQELRGRNWVIKPPIRHVVPQQPTTVRTRNLPGGNVSLQLGNYVAAQRSEPVHYDNNDNEVLVSDEEDCPFKMICNPSSAQTAPQSSLPEINKQIKRKKALQCQCNIERCEDGNSLVGEEFHTTLSYVVDVEPKLWLPVSLVEGRLCREIQANLSCIRAEAEKAKRGILPDN
ncbi:unnamed protein product [Camellia sinensis]